MDTTSLNTPPAGTVTPPAPEVDATEPADTRDVGGTRMAPVSAVIAERREKQTAKAEAAALKAENETLKQIKANWDTVEPYLPLLASHPKVTGRAAPVATPPAQDPELLEIAETWG